MPQYDVEVRISDVNEPDALAARLFVEERLRAAGFKDWRVVAVSPKSRAATLPAGAELRWQGRRSGTYVGSALLVAAVLAWVLWFLWVLTG
ncbi:hypothetical protein HRbin30_02731 [bacterium HR30]|nr:hypothetical protein HRbin30_02731 [bacterium HR30]